MFCVYICTAVAVVIQRVGLNAVSVAVDGSLYSFHPHFKQLMASKIAQLLPAHLQVHADIETNIQRDRQTVRHSGGSKLQHRGDGRRSVLSLPFCVPFFFFFAFHFFSLFLSFFFPFLDAGSLKSS